jgi:hypothetical protein
MNVTADDEATTGSGKQPGSESGGGTGTADAGDDGTGGDDDGANAAAALPTAVEFEPPFACVRRILKNALPSSTNVGKDASAAFARASGACVNQSKWQVAPLSNATDSTSAKASSAPGMRRARG